MTILLKCPSCGATGEQRVLQTRGFMAGEVTRRQRACQECDHKFWTYETLSPSGNPGAMPAIPKEEVLRREIAVYLEQLTCTELAHVKRDLIEWIDKKRSAKRQSKPPTSETASEPTESDAAQRFRLGKERQLAVIAAFASLNSRLHHSRLTVQQVANLCNMPIPVARKTVKWLVHKSILCKDGHGDLGQPLYSMPKVPNVLPLAGGKVLLDAQGRECR